jgi:hypothetical protein
MTKTSVARKRCTSFFYAVVPSKILWWELNLAGFQLLSGARACQFLFVDLFLLHEVCLVPTCVVGPSNSVKNGFATDICFGNVLCLGVGTFEQRRWVVCGVAWYLFGIVKEVFHDAHAFLLQFPVHLFSTGLSVLRFIYIFEYILLA